MDALRNKSCWIPAYAGMTIEADCFPFDNPSTSPFASLRAKGSLRTGLRLRSRMAISDRLGNERIAAGFALAKTILELIYFSGFHAPVS